jgi:regulator of sigma E protease
MGFIAIAFVFSFLVFFHELGHFLAAKLLGVRVERFSIGFPPRLFGKKIGDTDYCISAIPFGGYVKMSGMIDESMDKTSTGADYEFNSKPVWKRIIIIIAGVVMNLIIAIAIMTFLNYSQGKSILPFTEIGAVGKNGVAAKVGFQPKDKILSVNGIEVSTWNQVNKEFINNLNQDIRFLVLRDNQEISLLYKREWFEEEKGEILDLEPMPSSRIGKIQPGMPASQAGMQGGDEIIEIAGVSVSNWMDLTSEIQKYPGDSIEVKWNRNGEILSAVMIPDPVTKSDTSGAMVTVGKIGVGYYYEHEPINFSDAIIYGFNDTFGMIGLTVRGMGWVLTGVKPAKEVLGGPLAIGKMAMEAAESGWQGYWSFIAYLSAVLAFFNILPIPALDGGHLTILLIEGIRRKPLAPNTIIKIQQIGMAILLTFIVLVLYIDFSRIFF